MKCPKCESTRTSTYDGDFECFDCEYHKQFDLGILFIIGWKITIITFIVLIILNYLLGGRWG